VNWRAGAKPLIDEPLDDPWPVAAKKLLTERERSLYQSLLSLYPDHKLFVQVALSQLIDVDRRHPERESIRARYKQLVADFVLCRADLSIVAVIELDDRSHERADRQAADARKNKVLADAGIRLVRIPAGPLPPEDSLRMLIDAGNDQQSSQEETVLTLAEEAYAPASSYDSDESSAVSREFRRVALQAGALVILLLVAWLFFSSLLPALMQQAFTPRANKPVRVAAAAPKLVTLTPRQSLSPIVAGRTAAELAARGEQNLQAANALQRKKDLAWAAFYSPPASCEHPADWSAQVECGNKYMRAKKIFEQKWEVEHPAGQGDQPNLQ
jgi:Protein of unknown function (DUF2726)